MDARIEPTGAVGGGTGLYAPTREEMVLLVKHWYTELLRDAWLYFLMGYSGQWRVRIFANERINLAAGAIGSEAVNKAIEKARGEFKAKVDSPRLWRIYESGQWELLETVEEDWVQQLFDQPRNDSAAGFNGRGKGSSGFEGGLGRKRS
jgi:hypothetical protein